MSFPSCSQGLDLTTGVDSSAAFWLVPVILPFFLICLLLAPCPQPVFAILLVFEDFMMTSELVIA